MITEKDVYGQDPNYHASFSQALEALHNGKRVTREGWNGKGLFVFAQVPSTIPFETIPKMQSLPEDVKRELVARGKPISYSNQLAIVKQDNNINGWVPSVSDLTAKDWIIL